MPTRGVTLHKGLRRQNIFSEAIMPQSGFLTAINNVDPTARDDGMHRASQHFCVNTIFRSLYVREKLTQYLNVNDS